MCKRKQRVQVKIKVGLPLTTHTTKLGYKLLHGNPLSVSYSPLARIVLHWVRLADATAWLVVLAVPYKLHWVSLSFSTASQSRFLTKLTGVLHVFSKCYVVIGAAVVGTCRCCCCFWCPCWDFPLRLPLTFRWLL